MTKFMQIIPIVAALALSAPNAARAQTADPASPAAAPDEQVAAGVLQANQQLQRADRAARRARSTFVQNLRPLTRVIGGPARNHALIVRSSEINQKDEQNLDEDLAIMSRLLNKAAGNPGGDATVMGIDLVFAPERNRFSSMYLEGYGALFTLTVDFPLLAPPATPSAPTAEKPAEDSAWREAREELFGNSSGGGPDMPEGEEFSAEKVSHLKDSLLEALQDAANIRELKPDEAITVCVLGAPANGQQAARGVAARKTILTIRIKKSDADAVARGKMTPEAFRKRASIFAYHGASGGTRGGFGFGFDSGGGVGGGFGAGGGSSE